MNRADAYIYGAEYEINGGNTSETHLFQTTPVGLFPAGNSAEGLADLSGNVYEWTISLWGEDVNKPEFPYPYTDDRELREELTAADQVRRVVRGGSWGDYVSSRARRCIGSASRYSSSQPQPRFSPSESSPISIGSSDLCLLGGGAVPACPSVAVAISPFCAKRSRIFLSKIRPFFV